jgi:predicted phage terminase large subunit-like protein
MSTDPWQVALDAWSPKKGDWQPLPHQEPPLGSWTIWLLLGGRGAGKTDGDAAYVDAHAKGPPCDPRLPGGHRVGIIAPTLGDAIEACVNGPSGLKAHNPDIRLVQTGGGSFVRWPNGAEAKLFGAHTRDDVERLRAGGNRCLVWTEELAAWRQLTEAWNHMRFGLRVGPRPHVVGSTTPKNRPLIRDLAKRADDPTDTAVVITRATTDDNPHLAASVRADLYDAYAGTRLGRQELAGELLEDVEGALWTPQLLEAMHAAKPSTLPDMLRLVVAVDPSGTSGGDECGIVVAGRGVDRRAYVLDDVSMRGSPDTWGHVAVAAYRDHSADRLLAEVNFGADMVQYVIETVDPTVLFTPVRASRGKVQRAEPVAALYEQGRVTHVDWFPELESQMTTWVPGESGFSPDRVDALVWALTDLMLDSGPTTIERATGTLPSVDFTSERDRSRSMVLGRGL